MAKSPLENKKRIQKLKEKIKETKKAAYIKGSPDYTDEDFEESKGEKRAQRKLKRLEKRLKKNTPLKHAKKEEHMHVGEATDRIQEDEKSQYVVDMYKGDTLRPASGKKFNPNKVRQGYVMGGDYLTTKVSNKNFKLKK